MRIKKKQIKTVITIWFIGASIMSAAQDGYEIIETFDNISREFEIIGRGSCLVRDGVLRTRDAYALFGSETWKNYRVQFRARVPESAEQVQIWVGFRAYNRNDRYALGFRGGKRNDLYLSRMGYMGADELLALQPLGFHPEPGEWYRFKMEVCGSRIRVFLNDESIPRIDIEEENSYLAPSGKVILGGGWIETEFDDLTVTSLPADALDGIPTREFRSEISPQQKEKQRKAERVAYQEVTVKLISKSRTEIPLNGNWLFMPGYEMDTAEEAVSPFSSDENWHVMPVPNFWNPSRIWLHGERFNSFPKGTSDTHFQKETARCEAYTFDYKKTKSAWYRHWINLPENIRGKQITLNFDAVSKAAEVYINGEWAGSNAGMFGSFQVDGSGLFNPGKNLVAVKVLRDYVEGIADADEVVDVAVTVPVTNKMLKDIAHGFYREDPAGIWQPVKLVITNPVKIEDVFVKPHLSGAGFEITVKNYSPDKARFDIFCTIAGKDAGNELFNGTPVKKIRLNGGEEQTITFSAGNLKPRLWSPQKPHLYDFKFQLKRSREIIDDKTVCSGFRTFEVKDGRFYLNGNPYRLRGANHTPFSLAPNDSVLANTFFRLMRAGNMDVTRTHTAPHNKRWMEASDRVGVGISFEGTWPWLMIQSSMLEQELIDLWADEFLRLVKKYRNHPSLLFWTVNNEMKFYDNDPDVERAKKKMKIISDVVKQMRKIDPTRPVCFDSNYRRNEKKFGKEFFREIDDGDIDDVHAYYNWYNSTLFKQFNGEFQKNYKNDGRPLISQEMSTGYPNNETGHATRFYTLVHQNPQSLIGNKAYAFADPGIFLNVHAFITGELAEALRRSNDKASGFLHFALVTWFRNVYDAQTIEPYPVYDAVKKALQPVLVSAELWGRHFYAGEKITARICVVNDKEDGKTLKPTRLTWRLVSESGENMASGSELIPEVPHYERKWIVPTITIPESLPDRKTRATLQLRLTENGIPVSENEYKIMCATKQWSRGNIPSGKEIMLIDFNRFNQVLDYFNIEYETTPRVSEALASAADLYIFSGLDSTNCSEQEIQQIRSFVERGGKILLLGSPSVSKRIFPEYITGWIVPPDGDIVNMEIPESPVFEGIALLDLRYFNNNKREVPAVCNYAMKITRKDQVKGLASHIKIHGYVSGTMEERSEYMKTIKGFPVLKIHHGGTATISTMMHEKGLTDPVAGRLITNMINDLLR